MGGVSKVVPFYEQPTCFKEGCFLYLTQKNQRTAVD